MKIKRYVLLLTTLIMTFVFVSCGSTDDSSAAPASSKEPTPVEQLSSDEKTVFDAIIKNNSFYNQKDIRVLDCVKADGQIFLGIQGTNKMGGTVSKAYVIKNGEMSQIDDWDSIKDDESWKLAAALIKYPSGKTSIGTIYDYADKVEVKHFPDDSVGKINKAIKYYWEEKGLL